MILGLFSALTIVLAYTLDDLFMFISVISPFYIIGTPVIMIIWIKDVKEIFYFLLTTKKLYIYYQKSHFGLGGVRSYPIGSFKGIIFRKRFFDKNYDSGTIEFVSEDLLPKKIKLKNVPQIQKLQTTIESILFYYGSLQERWEQIKDKYDYQFPQIYDISEIKLKELKKLKRILSVVCSVILIICFFISFLIKNLDTTIITFSVGIGLDIFFMIDIVIMISRTSDIRNQLIINENEFLLKKEKTTSAIPITKTTSINILCSKGSFASQKTIIENFDFIKINNSYKSKISIKFGPFTKLPYLINFLFCYLIVWKSNHGYLMPKETLINQKS